MWDCARYRFSTPPLKLENEPTSESAMSDLAIVIVTWNNAAVIAAALRSLLKDLDSSGLQYEIWLVDSASSDATVDIIRRDFSCVKLIACERNIGFAAANNLALRRLGFGDGNAPSAGPRAVYLLNPDTVTHPGACRLLYDTLMARADVGIVGARLTFADGSFQHSAFRFPDLRQLWCEFFPAPSRFIDGSFNGRYPRDCYAGDAPFAVDFPLGATMMLKREVIAQSGLFDEDFFMYCEEVDWAWRIRNLGWRALCVPRAHVTHIGGGSTSQARPRSLINLWKSRLLLYDKHYPNWKSRLARQLVILGMRRRLRGRDGTNAELRQACHNIIELAKSCPISPPSS